VAYADALLGELADLEAAYVAVLQASAIDDYEAIPGVIGLPPWGWARDKSSVAGCARVVRRATGRRRRG
jgi:hypothetical protein